VALLMAGWEVGWFATNENCLLRLSSPSIRAQASLPPEHPAKMAVIGETTGQRYFRERQVVLD
jgi:hypothetical protein